MNVPGYIFLRVIVYTDIGRGDEHIFVSMICVLNVMSIQKIEKLS